uniref:Uncharacterized protein n=1 Tax=Mycena chlorophos TaxID=658473 RepID=A0ABQ0L6U0_MYCCL|nr:predicted protein [Mycena chlorophos]
MNIALPRKHNSTSQLIVAMYSSQTLRRNGFDPFILKNAHWAIPTPTKHALKPLSAAYSPRPPRDKYICPSPEIWHNEKGAKKSNRGSACPCTSACILSTRELTLSGLQLRNSDGKEVPATELQILLAAEYTSLIERLRRFPALRDVSKRYADVDTRRR